MTRRIATHAGALLVGAVVGAVAMTFAPAWVTELMPGAPVTAVTESRRSPQTLVVQQAAASAFATIGDALAKAMPGDIVMVGPGEYREQLTLRSGVTVTSQVPHRAVIRVPSASVAIPAVTVDGVHDARLQGFQILGDRDLMQIGVLVLNGEVELEDLRISGATDTAVDVWGGTAVTLRANDIADNTGTGVHVRSGARPTLLHNRIVRNGRASRAAPGVLLEAGATPLMVGNVIADNGAHGIAGVASADGAEYLRNNVFVADAKANARGALALLGAPTPARR